MFIRLMNEYKLREMYKPSMADLSLCFYQLESLVEVGTLSVAVTLILIRSYTLN